MPKTNELRFHRWELPPNTSLSAVVPADMDKCGIYILEFDDGELYVGQTRSLLSRFSAHVRHQKGRIIAVQFSPASAAQLSDAEADVVARLVSQGAHLRNIDLVTLPLRSEALDILIEPETQAAWLNDSNVELDVGDRGQIAAQRAKTAPKHAALREHPSFTAIIEVVSQYIRTCIPLPQITERRFWVLTSLPATGRRKGTRRLATLSINNVEVLVLGESQQEATAVTETHGFLNVAAGQGVRKQLKNNDLFAVEKGSYQPVGNVEQIHFGCYGTLTKLLETPVIARAARHLAMGLLRKGPSMFARFHDYNLSDEVFRYLAATP